MEQCTTYGAVFIGDQQAVNKIVSFDPETGKVYDSKKNYIGQGEIKNGILQITLTEHYSHAEI